MINRPIRKQEVIKLISRVRFKRITDKEYIYERRWLPVDSYHLIKVHPFLWEVSYKLKGETYIMGNYLTQALAIDCVQNHHNEIIISFMNVQR